MLHMKYNFSSIRERQQNFYHQKCFFTQSVICCCLLYVIAYQDHFRASAHHQLVRELRHNGLVTRSLGQQTVFNSQTDKKYQSGFPGSLFLIWQRMIKDDQLVRPAQACYVIQNPAQSPSHRHCNNKQNCNTPADKMQVSM